MAPPFRNEQIGSLLRPKELLEARASLASPSQMYSLDVPAAARAAERAAIGSAVRAQLRRGVRPITDGEYGRHIYYGGFFERLGGFEARAALPIPGAFRTGFPTTAGLAATAGATTRAAVVLPGGEEGGLWAAAKLTMPAPSYQHIQLRPGTAWTADSGYASDEAYLDDVAACGAAELRTLRAAGLRNVQVDDPHLTYFASAAFLDGCRRDGTDADALLGLYLRAHGRLLAGRPAGLHVGLHLCRGNMAGSVSWVEGSYEAIAERVLGGTGYDTYYLEFDDVARAGGFAPLRFLPRGRNVVLGLVSTKRPALEDPRALAESVRAAARVIADAQGVPLAEALDCLAISPQCGFSSSSLAGGKGVTEDIMWRKLELVKQVADDVWG
ncbi:putative UROD -like protein [Rosellinia necatrix]|uniref:Putative UROD-like protein n=1 Tax=Rosellinia necatrix TaxID=77044 RepID=A0A1S7ULS6_ROSNE|nr:putative UROD -like protein [Rosellinia necatrix]